MMANKMNLEELVKRAAAAIKKNRGRRTFPIYFAALEKELMFEELTLLEINELMESSGKDDALFVKRLIYAACPELRKIAVALQEQGVIALAADVADMIHEGDRMTIVHVLNQFSTQKESEIEIKAADLKNA